MLVGAGMLTTATLAAAATPTLSFTPTTPVASPTDNPIVTVKGSGFAASSIGALFECSTETGQPTIDVQTVLAATSVDLGQLPVSCTQPSTVKTNATGAIPKATQYALAAGLLGPPATGADSAGNQATNDAANYPCPPASASAGCELMFVDAAHDKATAPIAFGFQNTTTSTTAPSGSTTTAACDAKPASITATNPKTNQQATVTITPGTCLVSGQTVTVTATGLAPSLGSILECSSAGSSGVFNGTDGATLDNIVGGSLDMSQLLGTTDKTGSLFIQASGGYATVNYTGVTVTGTDATFTGLSLKNGTGSWTVKKGAAVSEGQASVTYLATAIPISCTQVKPFQVNPDGTIGTQYQKFTVVEGQTGPPCGGSPTVPCDSPNDSSGGSPSADAAAFPCPPTTAQTAAGVTCVMAVGDLGGDKVAIPISFNIGAPPIATTTTSASSSGQLTSSGNGSSGGGSGGSGVTAASGGSLAFTGSGPVTWVIGLLGMLFVLLGASALLLVDAPRRLLLATARRIPRALDARRKR